MKKIDRFFGDSYRTCRDDMASFGMACLGLLLGLVPIRCRHRAHLGNAGTLIMA